MAAAVPFAPCSYPSASGGNPAARQRAPWSKRDAPHLVLREGAVDWMFALRTGMCTWINNSDKYQEQNMGFRWLLVSSPMARLIAAV